MSEIKVAMVMGSNAPNRQSQITVDENYPRHFQAYYAPGMDVCGDPDCACRREIIRGFGSSEAEALEDYWEQWAIRYEN